MSTSSYTAFSTTGPARANLASSVDAMFKQAKVIGRAVGEIGNALGGQQVPSARQFLDSLGLRSIPLPSLARARACGVPSCCCPSPDLGEVRRTADRPEKLTFGVRVRNTTASQRTFSLEPGRLTSETGADGGAIALSANAVTLETGASAVVQVTVDGSEYTRGVDYVGAIRVASKDCETMTLGVRVTIELEDQSVPVVDLHCCCHPRVRPLRWYHHYYCDPPQDAGRNG